MSQVRTCAWSPCGGDFKPKHAPQKYCSHSCSNLARVRVVVEGDKECLTCEARLERKPREGINNFLTRRFCNRVCASKSKSLYKDWELAEELDFLLGTDTPDSIAKRLGYAGIDNLAQRLRHNEQFELLERLMRLHAEYLDAAIR